MKAKNYGRGYKSKVLITGVTGFIGSEVARECVRRGYEVAGISRQSPRHTDNINDLKGKVRIYQADFREFYNMNYIVKDFQPDFVMHLGAITPVGYSFDHPIEVNMTNHVGTINLAEACRMECPELKKFVFASTMEVYGRQKNVPLYETTKKTIPHPNSPYSVSKYSAEHFLFHLYHAYGFPVVVSRGSNAYGREYDDYFLTEGTITGMLKNPKSVDKGDWRPVRSFLHIKDTVDFYMNVMESDNPKILGEVFNNGSYSNRGFTVKEWVGKIARLMKYKGKINWNVFPPRAGEIFYITTSNEKARKLLKWNPKISEDEGLKMTIDYWKGKINI